MERKRLDSDSIIIRLPLQVAYHPPIVSVSFRLSPRIPKNTRDNILATKEFVVNLISEPFVEAANETSVEAPADVSEWDISGLTQEPSVSTVIEAMLIGYGPAD
jgi:flavin reductase (DIM6/NTAB) family NADH-FMN oxidoreductase RutF